jgi:hypothetical protein
MSAPPALKAGPPPVLRLAHLSGIIYRPWPAATEAVEALGGRLVNIRDHAEAQAMFATFPAGGPGGPPLDGPPLDGPWAAVVFRGTEATKARIRDLADNLGYGRKWSGEGRAHSGYLTGLERVRYSARRWSEGLDPSVPLFTTGHSMGGALATLFAAWYYSDWPEDRLAGLVTFGAPKAIDRAGAGKIGCPAWRVAIPGDFAPHWPPSLCLAHPAPAIRLRSARRWPGPISRHSIDNYIASIAAAVSNQKGQ